MCDHLGVIIDRALAAGAVLLTWLGCASCGSSRATSPVSSSFASSPVRAALGFDASLRSIGRHTKLKYSCPDSKDGRFTISSPTGGPQTRSASAVRAGSAWRITVTTGVGDTSSVADEVRHEAGGYCVWSQVDL
jgi:hypothetical protein